MRSFSLIAFLWCAWCGFASCAAAQIQSFAEPSAGSSQNDDWFCSLNRLLPGRYYEDLNPFPEPKGEESLIPSKPAGWQAVLKNYPSRTHPVRKIAAGIGRLAIRI